MPALKPFNIDRVIDLLRDAVQPYPPAALFALADEGFSSPFEILVACMISVRTRDETTLAVAHRLFERARTPTDAIRLSSAEIDDLIHACTFHTAKATRIQTIARRAVDEHGGQLPCEQDALLSLPGVGPKCAALTLGIARGQPYIGVDIHVHRVTNRWGYVSTPTPDATMAALEEKLPRKYWIEINRLLVPFGKHICTGTLPHCSTCPLLDLCAQVGVTKHR